MAKPSNPVDEIIRRAMEAGEFANLPGQGKPLRLDDDRHTPSDLRMAHKLLKDNDLAPDWILEQRALNDLRDKLAAKVRRDVQAQKLRTQSFDGERIREAYSEAAGRLNKRILSYNLKVPPGVAHMAFFDVEREARRALEQGN